MIYDALENVKRYKGISENLDRAIAFLETVDLKKLPLGRTEISGTQVFANVMEANAIDPENGKFEVHKKYMDIQIDVEGVEVLEIGMDVKGELDAFNPETDFGTVCCEKSAGCILGPGRFVVCMAEEPHKPSLVYGTDRRLKKCVIKVAV